MTEITISQVIRSKRKTFALEVTRDARLIVRAPIHASTDLIEKIVLKKLLWIQHKQDFVKKQYPRFTPKEFVSGEGFLYLGEPRRLEIVDGGTAPLIFDGRFRLSRGHLGEGREVFVAWYREQAYQKILDRVNWYASRSGLTYNKFTITDARKRWGSCSTKGNLSFSWRLIMAPLRVIDYVVIHELAHLEEKNHSNRFWAKVAVMLPDYKRHKAWLKDNQHLVDI